MQVTIVGIREGENKNKKKFYNYYGLKEFSEYDKENGVCMGKQPVEAFSYKDYRLQVGDVVDFQYEPGYEGKATLCNIMMVQPAGNPYEPEAAKDTAKKDSK